MSRVVSGAELSELSRQARQLADDLDAQVLECIQGNGGLRIGVHAPASYGKDNVGLLNEWGKHAMQVLFDTLATASPEDQRYKFRAGIFGSVYFDMTITADLNGKPLTKRARITGTRQDGHPCMLIDATFQADFSVPDGA